MSEFISELFEDVKKKEEEKQKEADENRKITRTIYIEEKIWTRLCEIAEKNGTSVTTLIRNILNKAVTGEVK